MLSESPGHPPNQKRFPRSPVFPSPSLEVGGGKMGETPGFPSPAQRRAFLFLHCTGSGSEPVRRTAAGHACVSGAVLPLFSPGGCPHIHGQADPQRSGAAGGYVGRRPPPNLPPSPAGVASRYPGEPGPPRPVTASGPFSAEKALPADPAGDLPVAGATRAVVLITCCHIR